MTSLAISVKDLSKKYDSGFAVSHANFEVPLGTICGCVGPNGDLLLDPTALLGQQLVHLAHGFSLNL